MWSALELLRRAAARRGTTWQRVVVELSGAAEPARIVERWRAAVAQGVPTVLHQVLDDIVCVVDASTFRDTCALLQPGHGGGSRARVTDEDSSAGGPASTTGAATPATFVQSVRPC